MRVAPDVIENFITKLPRPGLGQDELRALVLTDKKHNHTHMCQKTGTRWHQFDYRQKVYEKTRVMTNADEGNRA